MARASELRNQSDDELLTQLDEGKEELFNLRFQRETGQLEDMSRIRQVKRNVARILTVLRERELAEELAAQEDESGE